MLKKMLITLAAALVVAAAAQATPSVATDLSYNPSPQKRVIEYRLTGAYAPSPNEFEPTIIIYGDGTVIRKNGAYSLSRGKLRKGGLESILRTIASKGFFSLKKTPAAGPSGTGGRSFVLTVNLRKGSHQFWADNSGGLRKNPEHWDEIVQAVTQPSLSNWNEYVPGTLVLVAHTGTAGTPSDNVQTWPCSSEDLAKAAAAYPKGLKLEGSKAAAVWKAFQKVSGKSPYVVWNAGNKKYVDSAAAPQLP
ncbi:MAG: hypothetical protein AB2L14_20540 [Candidatus Xenobiia bacterium LiM19]